MSILRRDFGPGQLQPLCQECGISGVVSVQARQTLAETAWLQKIADAEPLVRAVVGWVPLIQANVEHEIEQFVGSAKFKGVRHVVQDEPEDNFILRSDFNRGIRTLKNYGLVYDLLIYGRHLSNTIAFVDSHPEQPFILDHIAKPCIDVVFDERWAHQLIELGRRDNVVGCKFSGVVTEVSYRRGTGSCCNRIGIQPCRRSAPTASCLAAIGRYVCFALRIPIGFGRLNRWRVDCRQMSKASFGRSMPFARIAFKKVNSCVLSRSLLRRPCSRSTLKNLGDQVPGKRLSERIAWGCAARTSVVI